MTAKSKKNNIEIVREPKYAHMIVTYVELHGNVFRKPKEWYPELLYNSKLHKSAKISTSISNVNMNMSPDSGLIMELKFPMSKENIEIYRKASNSGKKIKIYVPRDKIIKILFDKNLKEEIKASNRRIGFERFKIMEGYGKLLMFDIDNGTLIIRLAVIG